MANSRDLVRREDMLFAPSFLRRKGFRSSGGRFPSDQLARKLGHLDGRQTGFKTFVAAFEACAIESIDRRGQQAIGNEAIEAAHDDAEAQTDGSQFAINGSRL